MDPILELNTIYYDVSHPAGFSSVEKLYQALKGKLSKHQIKKWLETQETYTLHRKVQRRFPRNKYIVSNINYLWQADLSDLQSLSKHNDGFRYILCVIDVFSKIAYARAIKSKTHSVIIESFQSIFGEHGTVPLNIQTDKGSEFISKQARLFFKSKHINFYVTNNPDIKASIVERFQRTLKMKMWKFFTYQNTYRYIDVLQHLIHSYNNTKHSSIKMCPSEVSSHNVMIVWRNLYEKSFVPITKPPILQVDDKVRINKYKNIFQKGYESNWSHEIFVISKVIKRSPWVVYTLNDLQGEPITGTFYEKELQKVTFHTSDDFKIDKILDTRYRGGRKQVYVKWKGYPQKFNSWVLYSSIKKI